MADLTITPGALLVVNGGTLDGIAGATVTAGQAVYADTTDGNKLKPALATGTSAEAEVRGIAIHAAGDEEALRIQTSGVIGIGASTTLGEIYVLSQNAGGICPAADLGPSEYTSIIGVATAAGRITLALNNSGVEHA